jgi:Na+/phosphate symporter
MILDVVMVGFSRSVVLLMMVPMVVLASWPVNVVRCCRVSHLALFLDLFNIRALLLVLELAFPLIGSVCLCAPTGNREKEGRLVGLKSETTYCGEFKCIDCTQLNKRKGGLEHQINIKLYYIMH